MRKQICLTGTNILVKVTEEEEKSKTGLIMTFTPNDDGPPKERLLTGKGYRGWPWFNDSCSKFK